MRIIERPCPLCNADNSRELPLGTDEWPMVKCLECDMVYLSKSPDVLELFENMAWEKTTQVENQRRDTQAKWSRKFSRLTRRRLHLLPRMNIKSLVMKYAAHGNVLDVGCGDADHVLALPTAYVPFGIEISKELATHGHEKVSERGGQLLNLSALDGLKQFPSDHFAAIVMRSFMEHDIHPLPILRECERTLQAGGVVIIKVPNYGSINRVVRGRKWCGLRFPDHVNYFTPASLGKLVHASGLGVKQFGLKYYLPTSDNLWMVAYKK